MAFGHRSSRNAFINSWQLPDQVAGTAFRPPDLVLRYMPLAMTEGDNIFAVGGEKLDRLTDLPINVLHQIQDCISIKEATRMSVLSRTWRYIWGSNPKLVFDVNFCVNRMSSKIIDIISTVLSHHHGNIVTFLVDITNIHSSQHSVIDEWMLFLSIKGIRNLTILNGDDGNAPYKLPSYVYNVVELERLVLFNCIFRLPCCFRGFNKLKLLQLTHVSIELDDVTSSLSLWMPNLDKIGFEHCIGLRFLNIYAPNVAVLCLFGCGTDTLQLSPFMNAKKMKVFGFVSHEVSLNRQDKTMKLTDLLSSWPNLSHLVFSTCFLKCFASGTGTAMHLTSLRGIHIRDYDFDSKDQTFALLSILRSSPNLKILQFHTSRQRNKDDMEVDISYFEGSDNGTQRLYNFQRLQIDRFYGSRAELLFIRFILASAPLLQKAILLVDDESLNESQMLKISKELMRFPRASPTLEIIYESWSIERGRAKLYR
ncbi:hypothetical protein HAX54_046174 [Datura stramonium]|uniref:FBD domain-containing protein n=1 Tax=Datura stramonium TaxID=4076 RepID=A0ABS8SR88_DATST|nr:hypothetical protein [Datura stramonium]